MLILPRDEPCVQNGRYVTARGRVEIGDHCVHTALVDYAAHLAPAGGQLVALTAQQADQVARASAVPALEVVAAKLAGRKQHPRIGREPMGGQPEAVGAVRWIKRVCGEHLLALLRIDELRAGNIEEACGARGVDRRLPADATLCQEHTHRSVRGAYLLDDLPDEAARNREWVRKIVRGRDFDANGGAGRQGAEPVREGAENGCRERRLRRHEHVADSPEPPPASRSHCGSSTSPPLPATLRDERTVRASGRGEFRARCYGSIGGSKFLSAVTSSRTEAADFCRAADSSGVSSTLSISSTPSLPIFAGSPR